MTLYALLAARWTADQTTETLASFLDHTPLKPGDRVVVSGACPEPPPGVAVLPTWADRQGTRLAELAAEALAEGRDLVAIIAPASLPAGWTAVLDHEAAAVVVLADSRYGPGLPPARLRLPHAVMARLGPLDGGFEGGVAALLDYRLKALRTGFPTRCLDAGPYPPPYLDAADAERLRRLLVAFDFVLFV
ncbi:MAG: hypothetical protein K2Q10_08900 [Rhodospirillales bacterium]|nr:hypothetical protein [Rhodospirillales bacterium]